MKTEAETECPSHQPWTLRATEGGRGRRGGPCQHLDLEPLTSRTVRYLPVVLSHPVCGSLLQQPGD